MKTGIYLLVGFGFGAVLLASGAFSWSVIYSMFHFQSFHMFGLLFSAIGTASLGVWVIKRKKLLSWTGEKIQIQPKPLNWKENSLGGLLFGLGWGITGACSAPLYLLIGVEWKIGLLTWSGALIGVYAFGVLRQKN